MQVIIIGCGKVGAKFAQVMSEDDNEIVIIANDNRAFKSLPSNFDGLTVIGVPIDQDVLKMAGIETADVVVAVTEDDNVNIMVCQVAKEIFKVPKVIARIYNPAREHVFHEFGLETICPTDITVNVMRALVSSDEEVSTHTIGNSSVVFRYIKIQDKYVGKKLDQVKLQDGMILGVLRNENLIFANVMNKLEKGDKLVVVNSAHGG